MPACGQCRCIGNVRRSDPGQPVPCRAERGERRQDQAQLADALLLQQELGERAGRPAAAGQTGIERGKARGHALQRHPAAAVAAPDARLAEQRFQRRMGRGGAHSG